MHTLKKAHQLLAFAPLLVLSLLLSGSVTAGGPAGEGRKGGPISISEAEIKLNERFNELDVDDSETLTLAEFEAAADKRADDATKRRPGKYRMGRAHRGMQGDSEELAAKREAFEEALFAAMDLDGNGELSEEEASKENRQAAKRSVRLTNRFEKLDSNVDGVIDRVEFSASLERLRAADVDANGEVTREEFRASMKARRDAQS